MEIGKREKRKRKRDEEKNDGKGQKMREEIISRTSPKSLTF